MRILLLLPIMGLVACASASAWQTAPTPKLCQQLAQEEPNTWGRMSKNYRLIVEELDRRGEDCDAYIRSEMRRTKINNSTDVDVNVRN